MFNTVRNFSKSKKPHGGFTLLEVLVAMVLIGAGLGIGFSVISSAARMQDQIRGHNAAMRLAQAKLDEFLASPQQSIALDAGEDNYAGTSFGYKIEMRPVEWLTPIQKQRIGAALPTLNQVDIQVFWGPEAKKQNYRLTTYKLIKNVPTTQPGASGPSASRP